MLVCSLYRSCTKYSECCWNDNSRTFEEQAVVLCQLLSHVPVFVGNSGCLLVCGMPSVVCKLVDHRKEKQGVLSPDILGPTQCDWKQWSTCRLRWISSLCWMLESLDRAFRSCILVLGLYLIVMTHCCRQRRTCWGLRGLTVKFFRATISRGLWSVSTAKEQLYR